MLNACLASTNTIYSYFPLKKVPYSHNLNLLKYHAINTSVYSKKELMEHRKTSLSSSIISSKISSKETRHFSHSRSHLQLHAPHANLRRTVSRNWKKCICSKQNQCSTFKDKSQTILANFARCPQQLPRKKPWNQRRLYYYSAIKDLVKGIMQNFTTNHCIRRKFFTWGKNTNYQPSAITLDKNLIVDTT